MCDTNSISIKQELSQGVKACKKRIQMADRVLRGSAPPHMGGRTCYLSTVFVALVGSSSDGAMESSIAVAPN